MKYTNTNVKSHNIGITQPNLIDINHKCSASLQIQAHLKAIQPSFRAGVLTPVLILTSNKITYNKQSIL